MIIEDYERLSFLDKMYLIEKEQEMIHEWQQYEEEQCKLPAKIVVKTKEEENGILRERQKANGTS